jgi:hypothetical protein
MPQTNDDDDVGYAETLHSSPAPTPPPEEFPGVHVGAGRSSGAEARPAGKAAPVDGGRRGSDPAERRARIRRLTLQLDAMLRAQGTEEAHEAPTARTTPPRTPLGFESSEEKKAAADVSEAKPVVLPVVHTAEDKPAIAVSDAANSPTTWPSTMDASPASGVYQSATSSAAPDRFARDWPSSLEATPLPKDATSAKDWPSCSPKSTDGWPSAKGSTADGEEVPAAAAAKRGGGPASRDRGADPADVKPIMPELACPKCSEHQLEEGLGRSGTEEKSIPLSVHRRRMIIPIAISTIVCAAVSVPSFL